MPDKVVDNTPSVPELPKWFEGLGGHITDIVRPWFDIFQVEEFAPALAGLILFAAIVFLVLYTVRVGRITRQLNLAKLRIDKELQHARHGLLSRDLPKVKQILSADFLSPAWEKFAEALVIPEHDENDQRVSKTTRPQVFFNATEAGLHFRFYRALPGLYVGVGLLLTFFGLVAALHFATEGIATVSNGPSSPENDVSSLDNITRLSDNSVEHLDTGLAEEAYAGVDTAEAQNNKDKAIGELIGLLQSAKLKFYTSVAGLGASIVFSLVIRAGDKIIDRCFHNLALELDKLFQIVTAEGLAKSQLTVSLRLQGEVERIITDIATKIAEKINSAFSQTMEPLQNRFDEFANKMSAMNLEAIKEMADQLSKQFGEINDKIVRDNLDTISKTSSALDDAKQKIDETINEFSNKITESTGKIESAMSGISATINSTSQAHRDMMKEREEMEKSHQENRHQEHLLMSEKINLAVDKISNSLSDTSTRFNEYLDKINQCVDAQDILCDRVSKVASDIVKISETLTKAIEPLSQVAPQIKEASDNLSESMDSGVNSLKIAVSHIDSTAKAATEAWHNYSARFDAVDNDLERLCEKLVENLNTGAIRFNEHCQKLDKELANCVERLHTLVRILTDEVENLKKVIESTPQLQSKSAHLE